jgi:hypothetical protein
MKQRQITVLAAESQDMLESHGASVEQLFDTIGEAKKRAKYYLTEDYMNVCESSTKLGYARVLVNGDCVADYGE